MDDRHISDLDNLDGNGDCGCGGDCDCGTHSAREARENIGSTHISRRGALMTAGLGLAGLLSVGAATVAPKTARADGDSSLVIDLADTYDGKQFGPLRITSKRQGATQVVYCYFTFHSSSNTLTMSAKTTLSGSATHFSTNKRFHAYRADDTLTSYSGNAVYTSSWWMFNGRYTSMNSTRCDCTGLTLTTNTDAISNFSIPEGAWYIEMEEDHFCDDPVILYADWHGWVKIYDSTATVVPKLKKVHGLVAENTTTRPLRNGLYVIRSCANPTLAMTLNNGTDAEFAVRGRPFTSDSSNRHRLYLTQNDSDLDQRFMVNYLGPNVYEIAPCCAPARRIENHSYGGNGGVTSVASYYANETDAQKWNVYLTTDGFIMLSPLGQNNQVSWMYAQGTAGSQVTLASFTPKPALSSGSNPVCTDNTLKWLFDMQDKYTAKTDSSISQDLSSGTNFKYKLCLGPAKDAAVFGEFTVNANGESTGFTGGYRGKGAVVAGNTYYFREEVLNKKWYDYGALSCAWPVKFTIRDTTTYDECNNGIYHNGETHRVNPDWPVETVLMTNVPKYDGYHAIKFGYVLPDGSKTTEPFYSTLMACGSTVALSDSPFVEAQSAFEKLTFPGRWGKSSPTVFKYSDHWYRGCANGPYTDKLTDGYTKYVDQELWFWIKLEAVTINYTVDEEDKACFTEQVVKGSAYTPPDDAKKAGSKADCYDGIEKWYTAYPTGSYPGTGNEFTGTDALITNLDLYGRNVLRLSFTYFEREWGKSTGTETLVAGGTNTSNPIKAFYGVTVDPYTEYKTQADQVKGTDQYTPRYYALWWYETKVPQNTTDYTLMPVKISTSFKPLKDTTLYALNDYTDVDYYADQQLTSCYLDHPIRGKAYSVPQAANDAARKGLGVCTPGLDGWYVGSTTTPSWSFFSLFYSDPRPTSKYTNGTILTAKTYDFYARNWYTVTYKYADKSETSATQPKVWLTNDTSKNEYKTTLDMPAPTILAARVESTLTAMADRYLLDSSQGMWRWLRFNGWFSNQAGTTFGNTISAAEAIQDLDRFGRFTLLDYEGVKGDRT